MSAIRWYSLAIGVQVLKVIEFDLLIEQLPFSVHNFADRILLRLPKEAGFSETRISLNLAPFPKIKTYI
jgi:hypothetical protein